jgi:hypothetical protein
MKVTEFRETYWLEFLSVASSYERYAKDVFGCLFDLACSIYEMASLAPSTILTPVQQSSVELSSSSFIQYKPANQY